MAASQEHQKVCATLQALTWRIQNSSKNDIKLQIETTFATEDLLGCKRDTEFQTLDSLLRSENRLIKSFTFSLLNTLASYQDGKKYLLQKTDLIEQLSDQLCSQSHLNCVATLPQVQIPSSESAAQIIDTSA